MNSYTAKVTSADGTSYTPTWQATNYYSAGEATPPDGIHVYGGKTGTTDQAGNCVILYEKTPQENRIFPLSWALLTNRFFTKK